MLWLLYVKVAHRFFETVSVKATVEVLEVYNRREEII